MQEFLEVGKITNTHGVRGALKALPLTDDPRRFKSLDSVYIEINGHMEKFDIEQAEITGKFVIIKFRGIDNASEAERYKGKHILVSRRDAVRLPEHSFFICEIIGCSVYDASGTRLGVVTEVLQTGSNDVYVIRGEGGNEVLIPALKSVVKDVSIAEKRISVVLPEGLMDNEI